MDFGRGLCPSLGHEQSPQGVTSRQLPSCSGQKGYAQVVAPARGWQVQDEEDIPSRGLAPPPRPPHPPLPAPAGQRVHVV